MAIYLATYRAQTLVNPAEWETRTEGQQRLWLALLTACVSPGIPIDHPLIRAQLGYIWGGESSATYQQLLATGAHL